MVNGVMNKIRHIVFRNQFDLFVLVIVLLAIMIRWIIVFNEEAKAPPIVVDNTLKKQDLKSMLLSPYNEADPVQNNTGVTKTNFQTSGSLGNTGYAPSGLGQPCTTESSTYKNANLPKSNTIQKCKEGEGLECVSGIYQGSICLKYVNQSCELRSDCSPDAPLCINQLCQPEGEVINAPCLTNADCKGDLGNLNHVCDPTSRLCVFDIWPKDSGCTNASQCLYDKANSGKVSCLTSGDQDGYVLSFGASYSGTSLVVQGSENYQYFTEGTYVVVYETDPKVYAGRYLIDSGISVPSSNTTRVGLESNFKNIIKPEQGSQYTLDFGTKRDGICVINTPEGAKPETIPGTDEKYPCDSGTKLSKSGYCLPPDRIENEGKTEDICIYDTNISCESGLCCTYDQNTVDSFKGIVDGVYTTTDINGVQQISGNDIKNIGRCRDQVRELYQTCQDNCVKEYICLTESDINNNVFSYCGNEWNIMNDRSDLNDCPDGFQLDEQTLKCKSSLNKFCLSKSDCVSGATCSQINSGIMFDPKTQSYTYPQNMNIPRGLLPSSGTSMYILSSKEYTSTSDKTPAFFGFYYKVGTTNTWKIPFRTTGSFNEQNVISVTFEDTIIGDPEFSVIKLSNGDFQVNSSYILEYQNNRKRSFKTNANLFNSGLKNGTSVFFEGYKGVYTLDFSGSNISTTTFGTMYIHNVIDSSGGVSSLSRDNFGDDPIMITYDSRYTANVGSDYFTISDSSGLLVTGDEYTYFSGEDSFVYFKNNSSSSPVALTENQVYYSNKNLRGSINLQNEHQTQLIPCVLSQIFLTEKYGSRNSNPYLGGEYLFLTNLGTCINSGSASNFSGNNSYVQLKSLYGVNLVTVTVPSSGTTQVEVTVPSREEYINLSEETVFNHPIGYFSDTTDIKTEITENNIFVTYDYGQGLNQTVKINYTQGNENTFSGSQTGSYYCFSGFSVIQYSIDNSFRAPMPSIPYSVPNITPYKLDRIRPFDDTSVGTSTVKFLSTYENINPGNVRTDVGDISILRKIKTITSDVSVNYFFQEGEQVNNNNFAFQYDGIEPSNNNTVPDFFNSNNIFGYATSINLSPITDSLQVTNTGKNNVFIGGTNTIVFNNQDDIDVILKYGSSELVIGYNNYNNAIIITKINDYDVSVEGSQTLNVEINIFLESKENISNPVLYVNNVYPISYSYMQGIGPFITDGRNLFTSTANQELLQASNQLATTGEVVDFPFVETSYNIFYGVTDNKNVATFLPFYSYISRSAGQLIFGLFENSSVEPQTDISILAQHFSSGNYILYLNSLECPNPPFGNNLFICNHKFMSTYIDTVFPSNTVTYMADVFTENNFSLISNYKDSSGDTQRRNIGSIMTKENTFPFYTPGLENPGTLDESYLSRIKWPYWIRNLNTGILKVNKIYVNWNPGNMENNMFFYADVEMSGVSMLLYLSPNFVVNSIKESEPVPIYLKPGEKSSQFYMLPYNKNLLILSGLCRPR